MAGERWCAVASAASTATCWQDTTERSGLLVSSQTPTDNQSKAARSRLSRRRLTEPQQSTTDAAGRFRYLLKATRNRRLVFRYGGSRRIGTATRDFVLLVPASTSIRPDRWQLRNGQQVLFTGRVRTRPLPSVGKLVEMQAYFRGRWRTFSTVRAGNGGSWRFPYRFGGTVGAVTYRFRARLPSEGGYPFVSGNSRVVRVVVQGG
jgi:hypothetical protein